MRDYSIVTPAFWLGETGKQLRGDVESQLLAVYLMTSPHSTMTGVFHCPVLYMAHETGLSMEGASKALDRLCEAGFCEFEAATDTVFVYRMASFQIAPVLKPGDNRIKGIEKDIEKMVSPSQKAKFIKAYSKAFCLSPLEAPPKPRTGTRTGTRDKHPSPAKLPTCPEKAIIDLYHEVLPELPAIRVMDKAREKAIREFWNWVLTTNKPDGTPRATNTDEAICWTRDYLSRARDNDFIMGRGEKSGEHKNWRCSIEYLLSTRGMKKVIEETRAAA